MASRESNINIILYDWSVTVPVFQSDLGVCIRPDKCRHLANEYVIRIMSVESHILFRYFRLISITESYQ